MDRWIDPDVTMWPCQHVLCRKCAASEINRQKKSARDGSGSYCCFKCSREVDDMTQDGESVLREVLAEAHAVCARPVPQAQVASFNVVVNQHASCSAWSSQYGWSRTAGVQADSCALCLAGALGR